MKLKQVIVIASLMFANVLFSQDVPTSAENTNPLKTGQNIPSVYLKDLRGRVVSLDSIVGAKPTVLVFYRGGWCPFCNTQLSGLQKVESELIGMGYQIIAISKDKPEMLEKSITEDQISYTLLSDYDSEASKKFGIAFKISDDYYLKLKGYGIDLEENTGNTDHILPVPSVYIVDTFGNIKFDYSNPDYKIRLDTEELLIKVKDFSNQ